MDAKEPAMKPPRPYASLLNPGLLGRGKGILNSLATLLGGVALMGGTEDPTMRSTVPQHGLSDRAYRLRQSRRRMAAVSRWHNRGRRGHTALHHLRGT